MAVPVFTVGQVLTAALTNSWLAPLAAYKTADETVTSSTAMQNDNHLVVAVEANSSYLVWLFVIYDGATAGDITPGWTVPAGATLNWVSHGLIGSAASVSDGQSTGIQTTGSAPTVGALGAGTKAIIDAGGVLTTAGTVGNLQFQWAQGTSSGTATTVFTGSALVAQRIA